MTGWVEHMLDLASRALSLVVHDAARVDVRWLALGVLVHMAGQVVRVRGWYHILRAAHPEAAGLRHRDVVSASLAGSGLNALIPARGGDLVKLHLIHRRVSGSSYATLAGTLIPEGLFEMVCGSALVVWAIVQGFLPIPGTPGEIPSLDVSFVIAHPLLSALATAGTVSLVVAAVRLARRRLRGPASRLRRGCAILRSPRVFVLRVASWQALGRVVRLGSLACFMAAFGLPVSLTSALLVMAAQGGGRIIPLAPVSAGLRLAMLSYGLVEVTNQEIDPAALTTFTVGVSAALLVVMVVVSLALLARELGCASPRRALAQARERFAERAEAPGPAAAPVPEAGWAPEPAAAAAGTSGA